MRAPSDAGGASRRDVRSNFRPACWKTALTSIGSGLFSQVAQVLARRAKFGEPECAPIVVARRPFEPPEKPSVVLLFVAVRCEAGRPDPLDVPEVKEFVSDEREHVQVAGAVLERRRLR